MIKIELFWNIVYYGIYRFDVFLRNLFGYLNPFIFFDKIKSVKKYYSDRGIDDMNNFRNSILGDRRTGISNIRSSGLISGFIVLIEYGSFNVFQAISGKSLIECIWKNNINFIIYIIVFVTPALLINNFLLFNKDKYLDYFDKFDKIDKRKRKTYYIISLMSVLSIVSFFILSFFLL